MTDSASRPPAASWIELLSATPPSSRRMVPLGEVLVRDPRHPTFFGGGSVHASRPPLILATPDLEFYCDDDVCKREQQFACHDHRTDEELLTSGVTLLYRCRNCGNGTKILAMSGRKAEGHLDAVKLGEWPVYGPRSIPADLDCIMPSAQVKLYYKGLSCEGQGLGIAASAYYRRIVEDLKDTLLERVEQCLARIPDAHKYEDLARKVSAARTQKQFSTAVEELSRAIPPFLAHKGQNLLALLHASLSKDLHASSDEEVLKDAQHIRRVLEEVAKRIATALTADADLDEAVKALASKSARPQGEHS